MIPLSGVFYFVSLAAAMLYLNMVLLGRRHWAGGEASRGRWVHSLVRVAVGAPGPGQPQRPGRAAGCPRRRQRRAAAHALAASRSTLIKQIPKDRPVYIQAYYSPEVPREFVETKADLLGLLTEYAARSGDRIRLNLVPTELYSTEARDAEKRFGIEPQAGHHDRPGASRSAAEIFLGVAFTSGLEEVVIPFFDRGLPVEYELTRSIRVVSRSGRKKVGILNTDAKMMGGFDMRSMGQNPEWSIVTELKKQYEVSSVSPDVADPDRPRRPARRPAVVADPEADRQPDRLRHARGARRSCSSTRCPVENPQISPEVPKQPPGGPFGGGPPPEPKGNLRPCSTCSASTGRRPRSSGTPTTRTRSSPTCRPRSSSSARAAARRTRSTPTRSRPRASRRSSRSSPACSAPDGGSGPEFTPLLRTSDTGGTLAWSEVTQQSFMGIVGHQPQPPALPHRRELHPGRPDHRPGPGRPSPPRTTPRRRTPRRTKKEARSRPTINVIAIADLDMISEQFFELRRRKIENLDFDNVTFVLNCVDVLAGDESFVRLRKKRPKHRTLDALEAQTKQVHRGAAEARPRRPRTRPRSELDDAQKAFDKQVDQVKSRTDLDERTKEIMLANLQEVANRRLDVKKTNIEDEKRKKIHESKAETRAEDPRDPEPRPVHGRRAAAPAPAHPRPASSSSAGSAARTRGPTRTGWPDDRDRVDGAALRLMRSGRP